MRPTARPKLPLPGVAARNVARAGPGAAGAPGALTVFDLLLMCFLRRTGFGMMVLLVGCLGSYSARGQDVGSSQPTGSVTAPTTDADAPHGGFTAALSYGSNSSFF